MTFIISIYPNDSLFFPQHGESYFAGIDVLWSVLIKLIGFDLTLINALFPLVMPPFLVKFVNNYWIS